MKALRALWKMRRPRPGEDGYVLATAVTLSFIVIMTVTAVVTAQLGNIAATRRAAGQLEARTGAENAIDQWFADFLNDAETGQGMTPDALAAKYGVGGRWKWFRAADLDALCSTDADASGVCVHIEAKALGSATPANDYLIEVTARSRCLGGTIDPSSGRYEGTNAKCIVKKYQQRLRKKQYFDYLSFTVQETVVAEWLSTTLWDPYKISSTDARVPVAYTGGDILDGPVRTDGQFFICGPPTPTTSPPWPSDTVLPPMFTQGAYAAVPAFLSPPGCVADYAKAWLTADVNQPLATSANQVATLNLPTTTSTLAALATARGTNVAKTSTFRQVVFQENGEWTLDGMNKGQLGTDAVLYFSDPVLVYGTVKGRVTLATGGSASINVNGDLLYACMGTKDDAERRQFMRDASANGNLSTELERVKCQDSLGMIAGHNFHVLCGAKWEPQYMPEIGRTSSFDKFPRLDTTTTVIEPVVGDPCLVRDDNNAPLTNVRESDRYLVGAVMALGTFDPPNANDTAKTGVIVADRWSSAGPVNGVLPNLYFAGSMASRYRPIVGLALGGTTGTTIRGLSKKFMFDSRLKNVQPPAFLEPSSAPWERIDLTEVAPCAVGINGSPDGAGC